MKIYKNESGYVELLKDVLCNGLQVPDRTGVGSIAIFDAKLVYDTDTQFPFSTIRPAPLRMAFEEFWLYLRGVTDTKVLEERGINFWVGNTSREFLDQRGLQHLPEGSLGKSYSYQWRRFGQDLSKSLHGKDQLGVVYKELKNNPYSRRLYTSFWNPLQSDFMPLTPCWHSHQFVVLPSSVGADTLNLKVVNRSLDSLFGAQFAIQQYALYQKCMAKLLGMEVGKLSCDLSHVHLYNNQIEFAKEVVQRDFGKQGEVIIHKPLNTLEDLVSLSWEDFEIVGLEVNKTPMKSKRPPMAV